MKLTVKQRIIFGFSSLVILAAIMFLVSIFSLNNIGAGVEQVTDNSVPTLTQGSALSVSLLESELSLRELSTSTNAQEATNAQARYNEAKAQNQQSAANLKTLTQSIPKLSKIVKQTQEQSSVFYEQADAAVIAFFEILTLQEKTTELAREFGDMGDETLSMAYDLEGLSDDDNVNAAIEEFVGLIESSVEEANTGLASSISFEVMSIRSSLKDSSAQIDNLANQIQSANDLQGSEEVDAMLENLTLFKAALVGNDNAIDSKIKTLNTRKEVDQQLKTAETAGAEARALLQELKTQIASYTALVQDEAKSQIATSKVVTTLLALVTIIMSAVIAYFVTQAISKPLMSAVKHIKRAATGDMTVQFQKFREDELGDLADNMQILVNNLRTTLQEIADNSNTLAATAEETSVISDQSFENISKQTQQIQMMSTSIEEMTMTVDSVSQSIHQALDATEKVNHDASEGEQLLDKNVQDMGELEGAIKQSAAVISQLNQETKDITVVLNEIRGVAEQTNLLALNAAIEAARAGEQGRGFAVVADEVRALASRAHDATSEIQEAIERLQKGAIQAVDTMDKSKNETTECVSGIHEVQSMLNSIVGGISNIRDMSQQIATAAEEQTLAAQSQVENISQIKDISDQTSQQAQENQQASQQLAQMAENQQALMRKFKT